MHPSFFNIIYYTEITANILCFAGHISIIIFLFFQSSKSIFRSSYFVILNSVYIHNVIFTIFWIYGHFIFFRVSAPLMPFVSFIQWHASALIGLVELILSINRCTALAFPKIHGVVRFLKLWRKTFVIYYIIFIFLSPFIFHGYIIPNYKCMFLTPDLSECSPFLIQANRNIAIVNIIFACFGLILIIIGVIMSPKVHNLTDKAKMERRLIFQTIFSSLALIMLYVASYFSFNFDGDVFLVLSYFLYLTQFYCSTVFFLFILSPTIRTEFEKFYGLYVILKKTSQVRTIAQNNNFGSTGQQQRF